MENRAAIRGLMHDVRVRMIQFQKKIPQERQWENILPREIAGLEDACIKQTINGNKWRKGTQVHAIYDPSIDRFSFIHNNEFGSSANTMFVIKAPSLDIDSIVSLVENNKPQPPLLISEVVTTDSTKQSYMEMRTTQHNMRKVMEYLRNGGEETLLVPTPFLPPLEELKS